MIYPIIGGYGYTSLHDFTGGSDGTDPFRGVTLGPNGIYGTATEGGDPTCNFGQGCGVVWQITFP